MEKVETAFVSGHLDLTQVEFDMYYKHALDYAIDRGHAITVGDARGADAMAQTYLAGKGYTNVVVFHMFVTPRNNWGFITLGGFKSDEDRDVAMTKNSTYDIAWIRPGREKSGTAKNVARRKLVV